MLGMGIGGFVDGFARGYGLREEIKDRELAREERKEDRAIRREQLDWQREDRAFQRSERQRAVDERGRIDAINSNARSQFEAGVKDGTYREDEFEKFWTEYALPKMQSELILQNNYQGAQALADWSETRSAKKGRQLFSSAMFKAQTGDGAGAIDDAIAAGRLGGYIGEGFDISDKEEITDRKGNVLGYRLTIKDAGGNEVQQDVAIDDVPAMVSRFANPQTAWETQMATAAKRAERDAEFADFTRREDYKADIASTKTGTGSRTDAIASLRKAHPGPQYEGDNAVGFDNMPREQQEKLIADELSLQSGTTRAAPPAAQVIVDNRSGQAVPAGQGAGPTQTAPGLGESPKPAPQATGMVRPNAVINGRVDSGLPAPTSSSEMVDMAARQMVEGGNPQEIARTLKAMGVPEHKWPDSVSRPLRQSGN